GRSLTPQTGAQSGDCLSAGESESQARAGHRARPQCSGQPSNRGVLQAHWAWPADTRAEVSALSALSRETNPRRPILVCRRCRVLSARPRRHVSKLRAPPREKRGPRRSTELTWPCVRVIRIQFRLRDRGFGGPTPVAKHGASTPREKGFPSPPLPRSNANASGPLQGQYASWFG